MQHTSVARRTAAAAAALALLLGAGACGSKPDKKAEASSPSASAAVDSCKVEPGDQSSSVKVSGTFGKKHTVDFDKPLEASSLQRSVTKEGTGAQVKSGQDVNTLVSVFRGKDGKELGTQSVKLTAGDSQMIKAFAASIDCQKIGSRVVVVSPAKDMYGDQGNPQLGITAKDTIVIVTDLVGIQQPLEPTAWKQGAPEVTFAKDGKPTVKLPGTKPPKKLLLKVLKQGSGATVQKGDNVTVDYQGTSWDTGKIFDQSYGKQPATFATTQVVEGFGAALVGQKVGTRLVVSIPPKYAYGEKGAGQQLSGQTLVFVIDIKATKSAG